MGNVGCDIEGFKFSDGACLVKAETILEDHVSMNGRLAFSGQFSSKFVDSGVIGMVRPKNCVFHGIARSERFL